MLLLGPIAFQDFEVPECVSFGGAQALTVHRLPGGARVIDAMGRDDAELHWTGIFSGPFAAERARAVDLLRAEGQPLALTWDAFFYTVFVTRLEADYSRSSWIPYRLTCTILADEAAQSDAQSDVLAISLAALAVADAGRAIAYDATTAPLRSPLAAPGAATAGTQAHSAANTALLAQQSALVSRIAASEAVMLAPATATALVALTDTAGSLAASVAARGYVNRAAANFSRAST